MYGNHNNHSSNASLCSPEMEDLTQDHHSRLEVFLQESQQRQTTQKSLKGEGAMPMCGRCNRATPHQSSTVHHSTAQLTLENQQGKLDLTAVPLIHQIPCPPNFLVLNKTRFIRSISTSSPWSLYQPDSDLH